MFRSVVQCSIHKFDWKYSDDELRELLCCQDIVSGSVVLSVSAERQSSLLLRHSTVQVFKAVAHTVQYVSGECLTFYQLLLCTESSQERLIKTLSIR